MMNNKYLYNFFVLTSFAQSALCRLCAVEKAWTRYFVWIVTNYLALLCTVNCLYLIVRVWLECTWWMPVLKLRRSDVIWCVAPLFHPPNCHQTSIKGSHNDRFVVVIPIMWFLYFRMVFGRFAWMRVSMPIDWNIYLIAYSLSFSPLLVVILVSLILSV